MLQFSPPLALLMLRGPHVAVGGNIRNATIHYRNVEQRAYYGQVLRREHEVVFEEESIRNAKRLEHVIFGALIVERNVYIALRGKHGSPWNKALKYLDALLDLLRSRLGSATPGIYRTVLEQEDLVSLEDLAAQAMQHFSQVVRALE
jgi:hypothetical protein